MGKTRENIEAGRGGSSHIGKFVQIGGAVGAIFWNRDMGAINEHRETLSGGTYGFLIKDDREKGKGNFRQDLEIGRGRENTEGRGDTDGKNIHQKEISNGVSVGGPLFHF